MDRLSNIIGAFNDLSGNVASTDRERIHKLIPQDIPSRVLADGAHQNARKNPDQRNARIEHDKALQRVMTSVLQDDTELFRQFSDNESFRRVRAGGGSSRDAPAVMMQPTDLWRINHAASGGIAAPRGRGVACFRALGSIRWCLDTRLPNCPKMSSLSAEDDPEDAIPDSKLRMLLIPPVDRELARARPRSR